MAKKQDFDKRHRAFNQKVVNKITKDPKFRKSLLKDAQAALKAAGLDRELLELEELGHEPEIALKQCAPLSCVNTCTLTCKTNTCVFTTSC